SAEDVLAELSGFRAAATRARPVERAAGTLDAVETAKPDGTLLAFMGHDPVDVDALCARANLPAEQVSSQLLRLELEGRVAALPGGLFQRLERSGGT